MKSHTQQRPELNFLLKPSRQVHGTAAGCTWQPPPMDGSLTVPELHDWHYHNNPDHVAFVYPQSEEQKVVELRYKDVVPAAHRSATLVASLADVDVTAPQHSYSPIAILATTEYIAYFTTILGLTRAGIPVFPISPRNSALGIAHLFAKARPSHVLVNSDLAIKHLLDDTFAELGKMHPELETPQVLKMPEFNDIYKHDYPSLSLPTRSYDYSATTVIVHSSGSSSFPKPIYWNARHMLQTAITPSFGAHDLCGQVIGCFGLTPFQAIGVNLISWQSMTGLTIATYPPLVRNIDPSPENIFRHLQIGDMKLSYLYANPSTIEVWANDSAKVNLFAQLKGVIYGGSTLSKIVGDHLTTVGVKIFTLYGLTDIGVVGTIFPDSPGDDWDYFTINNQCNAELVPHDEDTYELLVVECHTQELAAGPNTKTARGVNAYATNDLLVSHPTRNGLWRVVGRSDDQIVLSTGKKTNPGPLEGILSQHPQVVACIMFGRGQTQNGILVQPTQDALADPRDVVRLAEFRNELWPSIVKMNTYVPAWSHISKEMIIFTDPTKPFTFTAKGAPRRSATLEAYKAEIEALYTAVKETQVIFLDQGSLRQ